tara:strand:+ start:10458 stop:11381 length:924 start_codon:yes stop_codon:yes gene_type:complete
MAKGDKKDEKKTSPKEYLNNLGYAMDLINSDPSLQEWIIRVRKYMKKNDNQVPTAYALKGLKEGIKWFDDFDAYQEQARMEQADPARKLDFERNIKLKSDEIRAAAQSQGVTLEDDFVNTLALDVRLNNLSQSEINERIRPFIVAAVDEGAELSNVAGEAERELLQWSEANGLSLTGSSISSYVADIAQGKINLDDVKSSLRDTYMAGSYPAWKDQIGIGQDIADIAAPYKQHMANLLELDVNTINLTDETLLKGLQGVDANGKPSVIPLYDFDRMIRKDPRWDKTENALKTYTDAGANILQMFGLR